MATDSDISVDASSASIDLHSSSGNGGDESPTTEELQPSVRVYCVSLHGVEGWHVQIFGGRRKNTPMYATALLTRAQLAQFRDAIDDVLGATTAEPPKRKRKAVR